MRALDTSTEDDHEPHLYEIRIKVSLDANLIQSRLVMILS